MTNELKLKFNSTFRKGFGLALEAFSCFYNFYVKFMCSLKIGGDRYRRDMRNVELHAEDDGYLLNQLSYL